MDEDVREELVEILAKAIRKEASSFRDPVDRYVETEAEVRWREDHPGRDPYDDLTLDELQAFAAKSWAILARACLSSIESSGMVIVPREPKDNPAQTTGRQPCCTVSYSGADHFPRGTTWYITWLPKGYGPSPDEKMLCAFPDQGWDDFGLGRGKRPPLIQAVVSAIETYMADASLAGE